MAGLQKKRLKFLSWPESDVSLVLAKVPQTRRNNFANRIDALKKKHTQQYLADVELESDPVMSVIMKYPVKVIPRPAGASQDGGKSEAERGPGQGSVQTARRAA
jgi:hypothetical protein